VTRWPFVVIALAIPAFIWGTACAPPPPPAPAAWYDAANDVIHQDDAALTRLGLEFGQPWVEWDLAHEQGHQTAMQVWRDRHVALWTLMPGATSNIQVEQVAQCLAKAALGHGEPWPRDEAAIAAGYFDCPDDLVAAVKEAS
jgi:hypothetical protein